MIIIESGSGVLTMVKRLEERERQKVAEALCIS
jgi:hypothetical protein